MENFLLGLQPAIKLLPINLAYAMQSELLQGFLLGYVSATIVYGVITFAMNRQSKP